jgi:hypothetical protein
LDVQFNETFKAPPKPVFEPMIDTRQDGSPLKVLAFPLLHNRLSIRVANLDDRFDDKEWQPKVFNITQYAIEFYRQAKFHLGNGTTNDAAGPDPADILIDETTLAAYAPIEVAQSGFEWNHEPEVTLLAERLRHANKPVITQDERDLLQPPRDPVKDSVVALEPQRIRNFIIEYHHAATEKRR